MANVSDVTVCNTTFLLRLPSIEWNYFFGGTMALISLLATFENGILLIVFMKYPIITKRTKSNKILISMALSDLLTGLTVGPLYSAQAFDRHFVYDCIAGWARVFIATVTMGTSFLTVGFISIDRAHHLIKLKNYSMKESTMYTIIAMCWIVPSMIPIIGSTNYVVVYSMLVFSTGILNFLVTIIAYSTLIISLRRQRSTSTNNTLQKSYVRRQRVAAKTSFLLLTVHVLMVLPLIVERMLIAYVKSYRRFKLRPICIVFVMILMVGNSAVNPLIYCARIPTIKTHFKKLFCSKRKSRVPQRKAKQVCVIGSSPD